jgi:hypothetical protein
MYPTIRMGFAEFMSEYGLTIGNLIMVALFLAIIWAISYLIVNKGRVSGIPAVRALIMKEGFITEEMKEGFGGAAVGAGIPDCMRVLNDAANVYAVFLERGVVGADMDEFRLLLSKWSCLKKDLMSPSGIVEATRYTPYSTSHDRIPVADLAGQCNAKTVPKRDLDITFETWRGRANYLLRRLCTQANMDQGTVAALEKKLMDAWHDVYNIATSQCLGSIPSGQLLPRDAAPHTPTDIKDLGNYKGYF